MIPFGSQRGNGADLATHLVNVEDNEYVEVDELRGVIADDLGGAFSEMTAKARALTKLDKEFYSLSINPDPNEPWSRDMYYEYRERAETILGLTGHDRATVFHIKEGRDGILREHCHVVWNRTDVQNKRGVTISYDRLKLMSLTREFAQDHGLRLPNGYYKIGDNHEQTSLYEKKKEADTGISKEQHKTVVTDLWRTSDGAKAFVAALEDRGYMLATGRRPYVLVDTFGKMHALPRLIDDSQVRTKDVEAFLKKDFPPERLSSVEEAKAVAAQHEQSRKRVELSQRLNQQKEILKHDQAKRRDKLQAEISAKQERHKREEARLSDRHGDNLYIHKLNAAQADMQVNFKRAANAPTGLAGFLSRVTGMDIIRSKLHAHQDRKREAHQKQMRIEIEEKSRIERLEQKRVHSLEMLEMRRKENNQKKSFEREYRSIVMAQEREKVAHYSKDYQHMPSVHLALTPKGRMAVPAKAQRRHYAPTVKEANRKQKDTEKQGGNSDSGKVDKASNPHLSPSFAYSYKLDIYDKSDQRAGTDGYGIRDKTGDKTGYQGGGDEWTDSEKKDRDKDRGR